MRVKSKSNMVKNHNFEKKKKQRERKRRRSIETKKI
jgi:hypothetical protein